MVLILPYHQTGSLQSLTPVIEGITRLSPRVDATWAGHDQMVKSARERGEQLEKLIGGKHMKHWILPAMLLLLGSLAGCTKDTTVHSTSDSQGVMTQRQVLTLATSTPLTTLDADKMTKFGRLNNTIEGLYQTNRDGQTQLALAKRVQLNATKTTYTFKLWQDSRWSNGDTITAQDFVYAWRRALAPQTKAPEADLFLGIKNARQILAGDLPATQLGVHAKGRFTLVVTLDHPMVELPQRLAYPIFGPQNQRVATKWGAKYATQPKYQVYAGPFMVSSHGNTAKHWHLIPNPYYWDRKHVYLTRINVNVYHNQAQEWQDYQQGRLDEVRLQSKTDVKSAETQTTYTARPYSKMILITYRHHSSTSIPSQLLRQTTTRLAISHAVNRQALGRNTYGKSSLPAQGIVPAGLSRGLRGTTDFAASQPDQTALTYQPKVARQQWRQALKKVHRHRITLTLSYLDTTHGRLVATQLQKQLMTTLPGLTVRLKQRAQHLNGHSSPLNGDLNLNTQQAQYADPLAMLALFTTTNSANTTRWHNRDYDRLVAQASNATAFNTQRWRTLLKADGILMREQGVTPLSNQLART